MRVLGYTQEEVLGLTRVELFHRMYPDAEYRERVLVQIASHRYRDLETTPTAADGSTRVVSWSNYSADVRVPGLTVWGVGIDVTSRKLTEEALRENERLMNSILSQLPGLAYRCLVDRNWTVLFARGNFRPIGGIDAEELAEAKVCYGDILHPDDADYCAGPWPRPWPAANRTRMSIASSTARARSSGSWLAAGASSPRTALSATSTA